MASEESRNELPEIRNCMEVCVKDLVPSVLRDVGCCACERCQHDVTAIALNELPSRYVVTNKGQLYTKLSMLHQQFDVDIITAITKAAKAVSKSPRH